MSFSLQIPPDQIRQLAERYVSEDAARHPGDLELMEIVGAIRSRGYLLATELHLVARWKVPRIAPRALRNDAEYVQDVTRVALTTESERLRIEALTLLDGVSWPMASTILHWFHSDRYPILDFRALASVGALPPARYDFAFWTRYTAFTRATADHEKVSMRDLDRALWRHSYESDRRAPQAMD